MSKAWIIGGLVVVAGAGYAVGTMLTGQQVDKEYQRYVDVLTENYRGTAKVSSTIQSSFLSSHNTLILEFSDLEGPIVEWAGTDKISFDINYNHSFLASSSDMTISKGSLLEKIKTYQKNPTQAPFTVTSNYSYDIFSGSVKVTGEIAADAINVKTEELTLNVGSSEGSFVVAGDTFTVDWVVDPSVAEFKEGLVNIGKITLHETATALNGDVLSSSMAKKSSASFLIDQLDVQGSNAKVKVGLNALLIAVDQEIKEDRMVFAIDYSSNVVKIESPAGEYSFDKPELKISFDADVKAIFGFIEQIKEMQSNGASMENPMILMPAMNEITQKGVNLNIDRLAVSSKGETVEGSAKLKMAPFSLAEIQLDRQAALKKVDLNAGLTIPKKFLESLEGYNPQQFGFFVGMGFLMDEKENFAVKVEVKDGVVKLNGNAMPVF